MIKDIIVNLSVGAKANSASDYAISLAAAFNAPPDRDHLSLRSDHAGFARRQRSARIGSD
jgi:hypothetical protein